MADEDRPDELSNARVLLTASGMTVTVILWGVLVFAAIDFGRTAREGAARDWLFLVVAAAGAIGCMFLAIMLAARLQTMMRAARRSSTRPLAIPLDSQPLPPLAETPGTPATRVSSGDTGPVPRIKNPNAGKRAARR